MNLDRQNRRLAYTLFTCSVVLLGGAAYAAEEHVVSQKNKAFSIKKLTIKVGDSVKFSNEDSFAHNVFSLSSAKSFDLGSFGNGGSKSITLALLNFKWVERHAG
jgi:plastocyanin